MLPAITNKRHNTPNTEFGEFFHGHLKAITVIEHAQDHRDVGLRRSTHLFTLDQEIQLLHAARCPAESDEPPTVENPHVLAVTKPQGSNMTPEVVVERDGRSPLVKLRAIEVVHVVFLASTFTNK